jgi:hypothetical protein
MGAISVGRLLNRVIDGSLLALQEWRAQQDTVDPSFAVSG